MKRFLSYILIVLVFVQLLAPFTIGGGIKNNLEIRTSKAEAAEDLIFGITNVTHTDKTVAATIGHNASSGFKQQMEDSYDGLFLRVQIKDASGNDASPEHRFTLDLKYLYSPTNFEELTPETPYKVIATMEGEKSGIITTLATDEKDFTTNESGNTDSNNEGASDSLRMNDESILPTCTLFSAQTWGGCIGRLLYWGVFKPTSYIFALTGRLLDISVNYSVKDTSYRSDFVVEGWGVVRDFCNMFFIFILLYIAFGTILNLHSVKTKEMIINVVIIGLLINFSLFATQVIVDASNILTRVFYNSQTIKIGPVDDNNIIQNQVGSQGEIQLSLALVGKINPQRLILNAGKADDISVREDISEDTNVNNNGVSATTFILVTILASIVNIVGIIVFLTCSLIFISRVIGLWIAMIFAPLAFFSYTIPAMQNWEMVGWKRWWPETIKLAFMAPAFVFFMYLIIKFLETGLGLLINDSKGGLDFVLGIFVPFIFVMILLTKAKDIAKNMSGKIGQSITDGLSKVGGVALGAGIGGLALAGRASIGRLANKANTSGWLNDAAAGKRGKIAQTFGKLGKNMADFTTKSSFDFRQTKAGNTLSKETGMNLNKGTDFLGLDTKKGLGGYAEMQKRKKEKEDKFGESLGYDHHKYIETEDEINDRKKLITDAERDRDMAQADAKRTEAEFGITSDEAKAAKKKHAQAMTKVTVLKSGGEYTDEKGNTVTISTGLGGMEKDLERIKSGRAKEYALTMKRKSGYIYNNVVRDSNDNIIKFGHAEKSGAQAAKQIMKEFAKGMAQGAGIGAVAGSVVPGVGTLAGAVGGGLIGAVRSTMKYSGTTNRKVGDASHGDKHDVKDKYVPPVASHNEPNDSHSGDSHGGNDDHGHASGEHH